MDSIKYNMIKNETRKIILTVASIIAVAVLGSVFVNLGSTWFAGLNKPNQWIPDFIIPIVWTIIYIAFSIILSIWISKENLPKSVIILLILNGIFNILWCLTFFALNLTLIGNIVIVLNLILAYILVWEIKKFKPIYSLILSIYPIWISIATTLNTAIWILN